MDMACVRWDVVVAVVLMGVNLACRGQGQCMPQNITITSYQSRQLTVSWRCIDGGTLQESRHEYQVTAQYKYHGDCIHSGRVSNFGSGLEFSTRTADSAVPGTPLFEYSTTITGLEPFASYTIMVMTRIVGTESTRENTIEALRIQEAPTAAPANVNLLLEQTTETTLTWTFQDIPCEDKRGHLRVGYDVELLMLGSNVPENNLVDGYSVGGDVVTFTTRRLQCNTLYNFRARGIINVNSGTLTGPFTAWYTGMTSSKGSLSVTCRDVTQTLLSGSTSQISSYSNITVSGGDGFHSTTYNPPLPWNFGVGQNAVNATVTETCYTSANCTFRVTIDNHISPPTTIDVENVLLSSIRFSWSEATCSGSCPDDITGYSYLLMRVATGDVIDSGTTGANERVVTIGGLTPCTEYAFSVAGISGSVTRTYSSGIPATTGGQPPNEIAGLSLTTPQMTSFRAEWNPTSGPCPAESYTIEYRLTNKDQCEEIPNSSRMVGTTEAMPSSTFIAELFSYSTYEVFVHALNSYGNGSVTSMEVTTQPQNEPGAAPSDVKVTSTDLSSLSFSWNEVPCGSRYGKINTYLYQLLDENDNQVTGSNDATSDRRIIIDNGLMQCSTYKFRVRAFGSSEPGPYSDSITAVTSTPVTHLNAKPISSTELKVSWEAPTASCTANGEYDVEYRHTTRGQCQPLDDNAGMSQPVSGTTVTLSDLHPYSTYEIQVRASGGVASITAMTNEAVPTGTPTDVAVKNTTNTSLTLTWKEPKCTHRNGNITDYTYSFKLTGGSTYIVQEQVTSDTEVTFTGLSASKEYTFSVFANTVIGGGPVASLEAFTLDAAPGTVTLTGIQLSAGSKSGSVVIEWQVPDASRGDVTFYHIRYWKADEVDIVVNQKIKTNGAITMFTINGLEISSNYHFQIQVENAAGKGSWSEVYVFTVSSGVSIGVIVGSSVAGVVLLVVVFIIAVFIGYRLKKSNPNKSQPETRNIQITEIGMSSRSHNNKHHQAQQQTTSRGNDDDGYGNPDPHETGRSTSGYYEDLDKTTMNKDQEYQSIDNNENQPRGYQNIAMSKDEGQTQDTYDADYEMPDPDGGDKHSGNYEGLDKTGMEKDHEYQALGKGNTQPRPY